MLFSPGVVVLATLRRRRGAVGKVGQVVVREYHPRPMTRTTRNLTLLAFAVVLIGLLLILVPGLQRIELRPGEQDLSFLGEVETGIVDLGTGSAGAGVFRILIRIALTAAAACAVGILIAAIFKKRLRLYVIGFLLLCGFAFGAWYLAFWLLMGGGEPVTVESEPPAAALMVDGPLAPVEEEAAPAPPPPGWAFPAVAILISIGVVVLLAVAWTKLAPRWRSRGKDDKTELEELVETVVAAADEIQLGGDPRSAVLRCYREMVRILCRNRSIDHVHMTARELADALHRVGFTAVHVDRLTEIFELVRYGNRGGRSLAEQAIGCLEAIREAYAT